MIKNSSIVHVIMVIIFIFGGMQAQNLLPNPGFEICDKCDNRGSVEFGLGRMGSNVPPDWRAATHGSSDIRSLEPRTGSKHGGFFAGTKYEYLANEFMLPLKTLSVYDFDFYIKAANNSAYFIDEIGLLITQNEPKYDVITELDHLNPQFVTEDGKFISGISFRNESFQYLACGGESYLVLGRFKTIVKGDTLYTGQGERGSLAAYIIVDDFTVIESQTFDFFLSDSMEYCGDTTFTTNTIIADSFFEVLINGEAGNPEVLVNGADIYTFEAICSESGSAYRDTLVVYESPVDFELNVDTALCEDETLELFGPEGENYSYEWSNGDTSSNTIIQGPGTYTLEVFNGCSRTVKSVIINVKVTEFNEKELFPDAFTPDGNGSNDFFALKEEERLKLDIISFEIVVFNRWGVKVFSSDLSDFQWKAEDDISGVYLYTSNIKYKICGQEIRSLLVNGDVTLVK